MNRSFLYVLIVFSFLPFFLAIHFVSCHEASLTPTGDNHTMRHDSFIGVVFEPVTCAGEHESG